ncbi:hypothetical protein COCOBI_13-0540 [Coccomyxa sp. Obi]|nr:hypothetical protein COCOBI_13-0540 [Coccomyxa sp. Obi]
MIAVDFLSTMLGRGPQKANNKTLRQFNICSKPKVSKNGQPEEEHPPARWIAHELLHCVKEQQQLQYRHEHPEEDLRLRAALRDCEKCANSQGEAAEAARAQLARFVAILLKRVCVRGNALGLGSSMEAFNSLNGFIDQRLEALVGILLPWAADPVVCSALNALATGATDFTCKTYVRAGIAAPLSGRFALAVLRCALEQRQQGQQLAGSHLESVCSCLRMAFKSLDDALRIVASAPNGDADLTRRANVHNLAIASQSTCCSIAAHAPVLLAAIQLECSPIIFDASDKWVSPTLVNLLKEKRWVGDLCTWLHSFQTGTDNIWEGKPAETTGRPSSEFTGMLQLLKAVLQATELFSDRHKDLQCAAHNLILMEPDLETGIPVSLLESLIRTLCGETPMSTAHAHKTAFILRICIAHHSDWNLSEELFERDSGSEIDCVASMQHLVTTVSSVLKSALGKKQPAEGVRKRARLQDIPSLQKDPETHSWSFPGPLGYKISPPPLGTLPPSLGGLSADGDKEMPSAGDARRSEEVYAESVRVGMAADKAPAVAAVARAIVEQEETLLNGPKGAPSFMLLGDITRLRRLLKSCMPEATGFGIPIDRNRRDNICRGTATEDGLPQDLMEDTFPGAKGTLPNSGPAIPEGPPRTRVVYLGQSASKESQAEIAGGTLAMQSTVASQVGGDSLVDKMALNVELQKKLAELQRLKELKAAAVDQQKEQQSAEGQGTPQNGSPCSPGQRPSSADSPADPQASKTGNPNARDARLSKQTAEHSADPANNGFSSTWRSLLFSSGKGASKTPPEYAYL